MGNEPPRRNPFGPAARGGARPPGCAGNGGVTFKLEFLPLTIDQRWEMFLNETGLRGKPLSEKRQGAYEERLAFMKDLTPGDFATVKRQCLLLGEDLSADDWFDQLEIEVKGKHRAGHDEHDRSVRTA